MHSEKCTRNGFATEIEMTKVRQRFSDGWECSTLYLVGRRLPLIAITTVYGHDEGERG